LEQLPRTTLEQWTVLRTIVKTGGFAQAANALNKSQSAVSYAVARLQESLQVELLELRGRKAVLTTVGAELLAEAAPLIDAFTGLESRARSTARDEALQIRMVVDAMFPKPRLFRALKTFAGRYPHITVSYRETVRLYYEEVVSGGDFDIAIVIMETGAPAWPIADVKLLAVAAPDHPLTHVTPPISSVIVNSYPRAEIRSSASGRKLPEVQGRPWLTNSIEAVINAVRSGLCHALLPRHLIESDLAAGTMVPLEIAEHGERITSLGLVMGAPSGRPAPIDVLADIIRNSG
jgi:DNA-binding transcriptional LysR family regulator